jgi:LEA14-like dessication related protein
MLALLAGCAGLAVREPVRVSVAGIQPLPNEGLEARFAVKLRIQNPNDTPVSYDGVFVELELEGRDFGSGVSDQSGTVPRFGEALVTIPVTVPFTALVRQIFGFAGHEKAPQSVSYRVRGRLGGSAFGGVRFDKEGEVDFGAHRSNY